RCGHVGDFVAAVLGKPEQAVRADHDAFGEAVASGNGIESGAARGRGLEDLVGALDGNVQVAVDPAGGGDAARAGVWADIVLGHRAAGRALAEIGVGVGEPEVAIGATGDVVGSMAGGRAGDVVLGEATGGGHLGDFPRGVLGEPDIGVRAKGKI